MFSGMSESVPGTALHAAALQDHFSRLFKIPGRLRLPGGRNSCTLAQRLQLVSVPTITTPDEWRAAHLQSRRRRDSQYECSICLQPFRTEEQVLLSCSHVFHKQCISSFEKFAEARCCPLCRCQGYQKKKIDDGARQYEDSCATRIQAAYRGYQARKSFAVLQALSPPQDPVRRRGWVADKLQRQTNKLVHTLLDATSCDIDVLFAELDSTARQRQAVYAQLASRRQECIPQAAAHSTNAAHMAHRRMGSGSSCLDYLAPMGGVALAQDSDQASSQQLDYQGGSSTDWDAVVARAIGRGDDAECPICLGPLIRCIQDTDSTQCEPCADASTSLGSDVHSADQDAVAILSCSHAFHSRCLELFEAFQFAKEATPRCPCCRGCYSRIELH